MMLAVGGLAAVAVGAGVTWHVFRQVFGCPMIPCQFHAYPGGILAVYRKVTGPVCSE